MVSGPVIMGTMDRAIEMARYPHDMVASTNGWGDLMREPMAANRSGASRWVSATEAGYLCHVSERTIRRWVASGRLPADLSGPTLRLALGDLQPYISAAGDTLPDDGQPRPTPAPHLTLVRAAPDPAGLAPDIRTDSGADHPEADPASADKTLDMSRELADALKAEVADLRARLTASDQAQTELRQLLALMLQTRALPQASDQPGASVSPSRPCWSRWWPWRR
jgi:hypothetical protein